jgi:ribosome maturation factor RimP
MNLLDQNIRSLVEEIVEKNDFFLVDIVFRGTEHNRVIEVYIDGEKNISAEDCASISHDLDVPLKNLLAKHPNYRLDVSSPGIDRPLIFLKQYPKHVNRKFEIVYRSGDESKKLSGKLNAVEGEYLTFIANNKEVIINFNNIIKANVVVSFS